MCERLAGVGDEEEIKEGDEVVSKNDARDDDIMEQLYVM